VNSTPAPRDQTGARIETAGDAAMASPMEVAAQGVSATRVGLLLAAATLIADQLSKAWVLLVLELPERGRVPVLPFLDLLFTKNTGISYGLFASEGPLGQMLLAGFAFTAAAAFVAWLLWWPSTRLHAVALGLLIGGAVGNAIDRLLIGGVADFILLHWRGYQWYIFNIADLAIVVGVIVLLYDGWRGAKSA
jgi:signal peptidase II